MRLVRLAFISPAVARAIASGGVRLGINLQMLTDGRCALPLNSQDQQAMLEPTPCAVIRGEVRPC
jgi:hypothetical protein